MMGLKTGFLIFLVAAVFYVNDVYRLPNSTGEGRRKLWKQFTGYHYYNNSQLPDGVTHSEGFFFNSRGSAILHQTWYPSGKAKAVVLLVPGYGDHSRGPVGAVAIDLARDGYIATAMDHEGQGLSDGLHVYIPDMSLLVDDVAFYLSTLREKHVGQKVFVYGESMGGAIALLLALRPEGTEINGLILVAPMVKVADEIKPPPFVVAALREIAHLIPRLPYAPAADVAENCFADPVHLAHARENPLSYQQLPRMQTAVSLLETCEYLTASMEEVAVPFLVLHGAADRVTVKDMSEELHHRSRSADKKKIIFEGMQHALTVEPKRDLVISEIVHWLNARSR